ncbi:von Willebrand domain-containing protein [Coniochaeta hoffmannii]|uniref:von Willebrand domain-containing protein n=1 Tax=Coniochaeta hoffmannii TaxID=91930 RepID=A0AA38RX20_9PEZI|nr:von Willebrand domain-containing protein [Coniochaeta hoffmannii]
MLSVSINVRVNGTVACTELVQRFVNPSDILIPEARHSFPLYGGAVMTSFECIIDDKRYLRGRVKPTQVAKDEFEMAKTSQKRQAAALLEELAPEMFETALGNIPPHATVAVKLKYVHELEIVVMKHEKAEGLAISVPSSTAPQYEGSAGLISHPISTEGENRLRIVVQVADSGTIEAWSIESGHDAEYLGTRPMPKPVVFGGLAEVTKLQAEAQQAQLTQSVWQYASASPVLKKDFVLVVQMRPEHRLRSRAVVEPADSKGLGAMMVSLRPTDLFGSAVRPQAFTGELLFLLDRSGSMGVAGNTWSPLKIDTMRAGMELALSGLPDTCAFNIFSFGGEVRGLWPESRPVNDNRNMADARAYVSHVQADMPGTEVLQALKAATASRLRTRESTQVILITDGEVYEPQQPILEFVWETRRQLGDKIRFFTLGIGDYVSHHIMESIAELGGGHCEVVDIVKRPYWEDRLNRILRSSMEPISWSCEIALGPEYQSQSLATARFVPTRPSNDNPVQQASVPYIQAPYPIPPLQPYRYKSIFFLLDLRDGAPPPSVTITTTTRGAKRKEYTLAVESTIFNTQTIHHLAAKAVLVGLEKEVQRGGGQSDADIVRTNAEYLGTEYAIASKWTSFVAVEDDVDKQQQVVEVDIYAAQLLGLTPEDLSLESDSTSGSDDEGPDLFALGSRDASGGSIESLSMSSEFPEAAAAGSMGDFETEDDTQIQGDAPSPGPENVEAATEMPSRTVVTCNEYKYTDYNSSASEDREEHHAPNPPYMGSNTDAENLVEESSYQSSSPPPIVADCGPPIVADCGQSDVAEDTTSDMESVTSSMSQSMSEEEDTPITWRSVVRCQRDGLFVLDELLRTELRVHFCHAATAKLENRLRQIVGSGVTTDTAAMPVLVDTMMIMSYFETHLAAERDSWDLLMGKAERAVLALLGFGEDDDVVLAPLAEMLARSIAHTHFNEAVYSASVERRGTDGEAEIGAKVKTCPACEVNFDAEAWPECGGRAFVCRDDGCYGELAGDRRVFGNWDLLWQHQVELGHVNCPEIDGDLIMR